MMDRLIQLMTERYGIPVNKQLRTMKWIGEKDSYVFDKDINFFFAVKARFTIDEQRINLAIL